MNLFTIINRDMIKTYFKQYKDAASSLGRDIRFWKHFLKNSINHYRNQNSKDKIINDSSFAVYDRSDDGSDSFLHVFKKSSRIRTKDLESQSDSFFIWIMNLSIVRMYNESELFILKVIQSKYFKHLKPIGLSRKNTNILMREMNEYFKIKKLDFDKTNNRYIVKFIESKSKSYRFFFEFKNKRGLERELGEEL